jgi:hypothetical protein
LPWVAGQYNPFLQKLHRVLRGGSDLIHFVLFTRSLADSFGPALPFISEE